MPHTKKEGQYLNVRIDLGIYRHLEEVCEDAGQTKTTVVERALQAYFTDYELKKKRLQLMEMSSTSYEP